LGASGKGVDSESRNGSTFLNPRLVPFIIFTQNIVTILVRGTVRLFSRLGTKMVNSINIFPNLGKIFGF